MSYDSKKVIGPRLLVLEADDTYMDVNLSQSERLIRAMVGAIVVGIGLMFSSWWGGIGLLLLLTSLYGVCPVCAAAQAVALSLRQRLKA